MQKETHFRKPKVEKRLSVLAHGDLTEKLLFHLLFAALGALASSAELLFGVRPFGVALAAAAAEYLPAVAAGSALFSLLSGDYLSLAALSVLLAVRVMVSVLSQSEEPNRPLFTERPAYRITAAAVALLAVGVFTAVRGNYRYFDLFGVLLSVAAAPLAATLYVGVFEKKDLFFPHAREAGVAALVLTALFSLRGISFFGIYPAATAAAGIAFLLAAHRGLLWGAAGGFVAGLCFDWRMAPAFLFCGAAFGLLEKSSRGGAVLAGSGAAAAYALLIGKSTGLVALLPSLLTAGAIFLATDSAGWIEGAPARHLAVARRRAAAQSAKALEATRQETRLRDLSDALQDLSGTFYELSARTRRPSVSELSRLCDKTLDSICPDCSHRALCWGADYTLSAETVSKLAGQLHRHGAVGKEHFPGTLAERCPHLSRLQLTLNNGAAALTEETMKGDRTAVVAMDYAALGRMITDTLAEHGENFACDATLGERLQEKLLRAGYTLESAAVCGKEHRFVLLRGVRLPGRHLQVRDLRRILERVCRFPLGEANIEEADGLSDILFRERTQLKTAIVKMSRPKNKKSRHCGDSVTALSGENGYDYAFLCDGMGSGNAAALTSTLASTFLARLLRAGTRAEGALKMLSGFLAVGGRREGESSTTVDLLELDRVNGEASLYKCGAAPTYLLRGGEVTRFFSRTAPVGILESLDAERIRFVTHPGDVIVQISDGFTGGEEECPFLVEMLLTKWDGDAEGFARMALNHATGQEDDLSIIVTVVKSVTEAEAPEGQIA